MNEEWPTLVDTTIGSYTTEVTMTRNLKQKQQMSRLMTNQTKWHVRPANTQISLGIRPVWSESSLCAQWVAKVPSFLHADSEDSDQTGRMPRLIWVFDGRTCHIVGFVMRRLKWAKQSYEIAALSKKPRPACTSIQTDLGLCCTHRSFWRFCCTQSKRKHFYPNTHVQLCMSIT